jgi:hypothetical protein
MRGEFLMKTTIVALAFCVVAVSEQASSCSLVSVMQQ